MRFSHVFVARPRQEAEELAEMLAPLGVQVVVQPAFDFRAVDSAAGQPGLVAELEAEGASRLLIFTSTRAVEFGLPQLPPGLIGRCRIAAIGPATSLALKTAGVRVNVHPPAGFTSEDLLQTLQDDLPGSISPAKSAVILAAPGGRRKMEESLAELGWSVDMLMVYRRENAALDQQALQELNKAQSVLSIWTSGNAMQSLAQRLPSSLWLKICLGDWLVISERLMRLARAYGPSAIHLSSGPGNGDLFSAVKSLI